ncbi:GTPase Era [Treponema sp. Marseille-Q3903]|uniref:GTPase Era n=1 Tax=Treponema sp. Marseille-Q3903 TaxID=2766703 RepID=UPI0016521A95|nr:GTPase Era [Treponema sp. Marseille-Q3903]MBC6712896.1 GTPase Era [Treponema sp. Marseille-Q3903]
MAEENKGILKTAVVAIIGRPSAGKSTFLNTACQEPVSIVSAIPQTTRNAIKGIVNTSFGQLIFIDTPGYHDSEKKLNLRLKDITESQLDDIDCVLYIIDSTRQTGKEEDLTAQLLKNLQQKTVVAINKADSHLSKPIPVRQFIKETLPEIPKDRIFEISAEKDTGINEVLRALYDIAPEGEPLYDEELYTDQDLTFRVCEVIRGEAINRLQDEIPHSVYVEVADIEHRNEGKKLWIRAFLCVERESQKGIVIGKGASKIKEIRLAAIKKLSEIYIQKIDLDLQVKIDKNWRQKDYTLKKLISDN